MQAWPDKQIDHKLGTGLGLSAHKARAVTEFPALHPNLQPLHTPTCSSWLNQLEIWLCKLQREIPRGVFTSQVDLARKIARYIKAHNKSAKPSNGPTESTNRRTC